MLPPPPPNPKLYHITHVDNLASIVASGELRSDAEMAARGGPESTIGMSTIKTRRLKLPVGSHPGLFVGDCVPFYFCPRSIMLFVIHCANHPELIYRGGQDPIVHLELDLAEVVAWAQHAGRPWAFSLANAGARYASFRASLSSLGDLDWEAIAAQDFRDPAVKEGKQAEFLVHRAVPWSLVRTVGVQSPRILTQASAAAAGAAHHPALAIRREWYY